MRRVLAVVGAIAMVAGAFAIRSSGDGGGDGGGGSPFGGGGGDLQVICAEELATACRAADLGGNVEIEPAGVTADRLRNGDAVDADAWIVHSVFVDVVESGAPDTLDGRGERLATAPVTVAAPADRAGAIETLCTDTSLLRCLGADAGRPWSELGGESRWGALRIGLPPIDTGTGLVALASFAAAHFEGNDFARQDFEDPTFSQSLANLARSSPPDDDDPVGTMVTRPGTYSAAVAPAFEVDRRQNVRRLDPDPPATAEVVLVGLADGGGVPDAGTVREALVDEGWTGADGPTPDSPFIDGALAALRERWKQENR